MKFGSKLCFDDVLVAIFEKEDFRWAEQTEGVIVLVIGDEGNCF
jgi:hypothetical protein